jgi:hypothetical protein
LPLLLLFIIVHNHVFQQNTLPKNLSQSVAPQFDHTHNILRLSVAPHSNNIERTLSSSVAPQLHHIHPTLSRSVTPQLNPHVAPFVPQEMRVPLGPITNKAKVKKHNDIVNRYAKKTAKTAAKE